MATDGPTTRTNSGPTYAKIIGKNCGSYPYRIGLNTLAHNGEQFNAAPECGPGGLYFCEIKNILEFLGYGNRLCIVEPVGQIVAVENKFKTDKLVIVEMMELGDVATWKFLITNGVDLSMERMWMVLRVAVSNDQIDVVRFMIEMGVDTNGWDGRVSLKYAINQDNTAMAKILAENITNKMTLDAAADAAAAGNYNEILMILIRAGADVHTRSDYALRLMVELGRFEDVKFLIDWGADIHVWEDFILRDAVIRGHQSIVEYLVRVGADISLFEYGALTLAVRHGHRGIAEFLVEHDADIGYISAETLQLATKDGHHAVVEYITRLL